jgi:hypothetical protein
MQHDLESPRGSAAFDNMPKVLLGCMLTASVLRVAGQCFAKRLYGCCTGTAVAGSAVVCCRFCHSSTDKTVGATAAVTTARTIDASEGHRIQK